MMSHKALSNLLIFILRILVLLKPVQVRSLVYLSSIEEPLKEVSSKKEVEVVTENKKSKRKTKRYKSEKMKIIPNIYEFIGNTFPARNVPLSDWWVGNILQSALEGAERGKMWPYDFNSKGYIRASRIPEGRTYKQLGGIDRK